VPTAAANVERFPWGGAVVLLNVLAVANVPRAVFRGRYGQAFLSSATIIVCMVCLFALAVFPNVLTASNDPRLSLTVYSAASSPKTLGIGLWIVAIGFPFVLAYTAAVYWTFRGKVRLDDHSY
jgi:cytochrome d ubiquinol oxidase subunit II